jgi:hypothetical protein
MSAPHLLTTVHTLAVVPALTSGTPAPAAGTYELTGGRLTSLVGVVLGLAGVLLVALARRRRAGGATRSTRSLAVVGAGLGAAGAVTGAAIVALADGGPGSGSGVVGGVVCVAIGVVAAVLAAPLLRRAVRA